MFLKKNVGCWLYVLPVIAGILLFTITPMATSIVYALHDYDPHIPEFLLEMGEKFEVYGMVKDDKHTIRAVTDGESEFSPSKNSEAYKFLFRISERVHKSAIEYHRRLRTKTGLSSELDNISGIGDKRKRLLLKTFKSIENIKNATEDELLSAGLDKKSAKSVYEYFN
jgi:excinuclease ABC subunit C